jgi:hypothetical protein
VVAVVVEGFRDLARVEADRVLADLAAVAVSVRGVAEPAVEAAMEPRARAAAKVAPVRRICGKHGRVAGRQDLVRAWAAD